MPGSPANATIKDIESETEKIQPRRGIEVKKQLDELLAKGKIRESRSESAVSTLFC